MVTRAQKAAARRKTWHEAQMEQAPTPRMRLWRACGWLVAEAWKAGRLDDAEDAVLAKVHEIREEAANDRHGYAA